VSRKRTGTLVPFSTEIKIRIRVDGKDHLIPTGSKSWAVAKQLQPGLVRDYLAGLGVPASPGSKHIRMPAMTVGKLAEEFFKEREEFRVISWEDERRWYQRFCAKHIGAYVPRDVNTADIERILIAALKQGTKKGDQHRELSLESLKKVRAVLYRIFDRADRQDLITKNPVKRARLPQLVEDSRERAQLTDEEFLQYARWPSTLNWNKAENAERKAKGEAELVDAEIQLMSILARSVGGMRTGDLHALDWKRLDRNAWTLRVLRPKTSKKGVAQIDFYEVPAPIRSRLDAWWELQGRPQRGPVFPARGKRAAVSKKRGDAPKAKGSTSYAHRFRRDLLAAQVTRHELHHETDETLPVDFHSWRRSVATAAVLAGLSDREGQALTGHAIPEMFNRYVSKKKLNERPVVIPSAVLPFTDDTALEPIAAAAQPSDDSQLSESSSEIPNTSDVAALMGADNSLFGSTGRPPNYLMFPYSFWSGWQDLNLQQPAPKAGPLPG
jgi:integrase